jgi:hypothetical protein
MQVIYRHSAPADASPLPQDAREVRERLEDGNRRFSALANANNTTEEPSFVIEGDFSVKAVSRAASASWPGRFRCARSSIAFRLASAPRR